MATRKTHTAKPSSWKKVLLYLLPVGLLIMGGLAYMTNAATDPNALSSTDKAFLLETAEIRMMDWAEGNLAVDRGSVAYQQYGKRVMHDQEKMMKALRELASAKKLELPEKLDTERAEDLIYLKASKGEWFDRRFRRMIIQDIKHDIRSFESAAESEDTEVRSFAKHYLPMLEKHLQLARDLNR